MGPVPGTLPAALLVWAMAASGCHSPCEQLAAHADACGTTPGRYVDEPESVCRESRQSVGANRFDAFADCVSDASCDDTNAIDRCQREHVPAPPDDPCLDFRLWASACGLEPPGTTDDCGGLTDSLGAPTFEAWTRCMTAGGCPTHADERYARCRDILVPPQTTQLLDACLLVEQWTTRCSQEPTTLPVEPTPLPLCLAQAEPFTPGSYYTYATCLSALDCNAVSGRVDCFFELRITQRDRIVVQCEELVAFTAQCDSLVTGGTEEACIAIFARYTPESIDAYSACLRSGTCGDLENAAICSQLLVLQ